MSKVVQTIFIVAAIVHATLVPTSAQDRPALVEAIVAGRTDAALALLAAGADPNAAGDDGFTPLMAAAGVGDVRVVRALLERKARTDAVNKSGFPGNLITTRNRVPISAGFTALHFAARFPERPLPVFELLLSRGVLVNELDDFGWTPLHHVVMRKDASSPQLLAALIAQHAALDVVDKDGFTPLMHLASDISDAESASQDQIKELLAVLGDIAPADAARRPTQVAKEAALRLALARQLVQAGADLEQRGQNGRTVLMVATDLHDLPFVRWLLSQKVQVDATTDSGRTALFTAVSGDSISGVFYALLRAGANPNHELQDGETPLTKAASKGLWAAIDPLIARGADVNHARADGATALMLAAGIGSDATVKRLLGRRASLAPKDADGRTALMRAAAAPVVESTFTIELLLAAGASVDDADDEGNTPLILAAAAGALNSVEALLVGRAERGKKNSAGIDAAEAAERSGYADIARLLRPDAPTGIPSAQSTTVPAPQERQRPDAEPPEEVTAVDEAFWDQFIVREGGRCEVYWTGSKQLRKEAGALVRDLVVRGLGSTVHGCNPRAVWNGLADQDRTALLKTYARVLSTVDAGAALLGQELGRDDGIGAEFLEQFRGAMPMAYQSLVESGVGLDWDGVNRLFVEFIKLPLLVEAREELEGGDAAAALSLVERGRALAYRMHREQKDYVRKAGSEPRKRLAAVNERIARTYQEAMTAAAAAAAVGLTAQDELDNLSGDDLEPAQKEALNSYLTLHRRMVDLLAERQAIMAEITPGEPRPLPYSTEGGRIARLIEPDALAVVFATSDRTFPIGKGKVADRVDRYLIRRSAGADPTDDGIISGAAIELTTQQLRSEIRTFAARVSNPTSTEESIAEAGRRLFAALFPGDAGEMVRSARRLYISPDGPLSDLPFAALVINTDGPPQYLGREKPIVYVQSFTAYDERRDAGRTARAVRGSPVALVVGDPLFDPTSGRQPLPRTRDEARAIARIYGGDELVAKRRSLRGALMTGADASEANVRLQLNAADVVHFATHGSIQSADPLNSQSTIWLASPQGANRTGNADGELRADEVFSSLSLKASVVVLSACDMARGAQMGGMSTADMIWAFLVGGADSVVASQWEVKDAAAATMMVRLHEALKRGVRTDDALQTTVAKMDAAFLHPFFWAGFSVSGYPLHHLGRR